MKLTTLAGILCLLALNVSAQRNKDNGQGFGDISMADMQMTRYAGDTTASAIILFDRGSCTLADNLSIVFRRHVRIKFFTQEDIDEFSSETVRYASDGGSVSKIKASTYNLEGGKIVESKIADEGIFKKKISRFTNEVKFTLPNVKPGSIIEYSYTTGLDFTLRLPSWEFQHTIPTLYSEYETTIPASCTFRKDIQGFLGLSPKSDVSRTGYEKLIVENAPAFKAEPFITTADDYLSGVSYFITDFFVPGTYVTFERTWENIAKNYYNDADFMGTLKGNAWLNSTVEQIVGTATKPEDKAKAIHTFIKQNIEWDEESDIYPDDPLRKVLETKKGSSSEINMLMIAMFRKADLEAHPVLISTRDHGTIRIFSPHRSQFNDVICLVKLDGKDKFLDGTDRMLSFNFLPERCLNGQGLLINSEQGQWIPILSPKARTVYVAALKLSADGEVSGNLNVTRDGLHGGDMRSHYKALGREKYLADAFEGKTWEVTKSEFKNVDEGESAALEIHDFIAKDHVQAAGDVMYINPYLAGLEENVFKSEKREYPVNIPCPFDRFYTARIEIPAGYKVEELPAPKSLIMPKNTGRFNYSATVIGNTISFTSQIQLSQTLIFAEDYPALREFYAQVVAKQAEQIVLKKAQ